MIYRSVALVSIVFLVSCASSPKGEWKWEHSALYSKAEKGELSHNDLEREYYLSSNSCNIDAMKISVPSPSCTTIPAPDCTHVADGFAKGWCQAETAKQQCDHTGVNAARNAQSSVFNSCMALAGWNKVWVEAALN